MSLADYALPGADPDLQEPLASRLLGLLEHFDGRLMILSGRRSRAEQQALYDAYLNGGNLAAVPGTSLHELGLAADLQRTDPDLTWGEVHYTAAAFGLRFPIPSENWHTQVDENWIPPLPPEIPDMTKEEFAAAIGAEIPGPGQPFEGLVCVPLINNTFDGSDLYPLASAVSWIHDSQKRTLHGK